MYFHHNKQRFWQLLSIFSIVVFFCLLGFAIHYLNLDSETIDDITLIKSELSQEYIQKEENKEIIKKCKNCVRRYIDGVYDIPANQNLQPYSVIIDNNTEARPQFGLNQANIVYEVEAEGGITRYLAIYGSNQNVEKIGPIRSVRPYFIDITKEYSALLAHVGGSPQALAQILKDNVFNINEFFRESYFWRGADKIAPYNVYSSSEKLQEYLKHKKVTEGHYFSWSFKNDKKESERGDESSIKIDYQNKEYVVEWKFDKKLNLYNRYLAAEPHFENDKQILAKNVLIQYIPIKVIDNEGRLDVNLLGKGRAIICLDGQCNKGEWRKKTVNSRTRFYVKDEEVKLNAGRIWINMIRPEHKVSY